MQLGFRGTGMKTDPAEEFPPEFWEPPKPLDPKPPELEDEPEEVN